MQIAVPEGGSPLLSASNVVAVDSTVTKISKKRLLVQRIDDHSIANDKIKWNTSASVEPPTLVLRQFAKVIRISESCEYIKIAPVIYVVLKNFTVDVIEN